MIFTLWTILIVTVLISYLTNCASGQCGNSEFIMPVNSMFNSGLSSKSLDSPVDGSRLWDNAIVPFTMDPRYTRIERDQIMAALNEFSSRTCVRFIPNLGCQERGYVFMARDVSLTHQVGKSGSRQITGLSSRNLARHQEAIHQLMHVLGFVHEEQRRDAHQHLTGDFINCGVGLPQQTSMYPNDLGDFDYQSVTSRLGFGNCRAVQAWDALTGSVNLESTRQMYSQRGGLSRGDVEKINRAYNCA